MRHGKLNSFGSCRASGGLSDPQEGSEKPQRRPLDVGGPLEQGHILVQVLLAHAPERPQEVPQPRPQPLPRVAMHRADAVPVIVPHPLTRRMTDRGMSAATPVNMGMFSNVTTLVA